VTEIAGINGSVVKRCKYDAFGNIVLETGPTIPGGFTYTVRERHYRSGLYYYRARFYDPTLGRFITQDPADHFDSANLYAYVGNDPVNLIDPFGLFWQYSQSTGQMTYVDNKPGESSYVDTGYSGHDEGVNTPDMQSVPFVGPIPQGTYAIGEAYYHKRPDGSGLGPVTMNLDPNKATDTFDRDLFRIHGDNGRGDKSASEGCIVLPRKTRDRINDSTDRKLKVVR
jgi:RHS repeat-associated protein